MQCQKCRQPVYIDSSLEHLNAASFKILVDSSSTLRRPNSTSTRSRQSRPTFPQERRAEYDKASQQARSAVFKRAGSQRTKDDSRKQSMVPADNPGMSFVMLSESQLQHPPSPNDAKGRSKSHQDSNGGKANGDAKAGEGDDGIPFSSKVETTNRLLEILSSRSDIDHPVCSECTDMLVEELQKRLSSATRERDAYVEFLRNANSDIPTEEETQQAQETLNAMREQESAAFAELEKLEAEKTALDLELQALEEEAQKLNQDEEEFWRERNKFTATFMASQSQHDSAVIKYNHDNKQLERLQRTNVFNDTFCIGHDGFFGTINGLRMGRLSNHPVDWPEINAAWGQTCLLLATVTDRLGFQFQNYRLVPMGSTSMIQKLEYPQSTSAHDPAHLTKPKETSLELFNHGDMPLGLGGIFHKKFDIAMVAFLECLRQLGDHIQKTPGLKLPYEIRKDKILDTSIKFSFSSEENWTKACKYVLTCCKYLLAHASNIHTPGRQGP